MSPTYHCHACRHDRHKACTGGRCQCELLETCGPEGQRPIETIPGRLAQAQETERRGKRPAATPTNVADIGRARQQQSKVVELVLDVLQEAGGMIADDAGRTAGVLRQALGYTGSDQGFAKHLSRMEADGLIERDVRGRRTYAIAIRDAAAAVEGPVDVDERHPSVKVVIAEPVADAKVIIGAVLEALEQCIAVVKGTLVGMEEAAAR